MSDSSASALAVAWEDYIRDVDLSRFRARRSLDRMPLLPNVKLDLRYATASNICGRPLYESGEKLWLHPEASVCFTEAAMALSAYKGPDYRLVIFDAYRPQRVQQALWHECPDEDYVADPYDGGSLHTRGIAVDVTLGYRYLSANPKEVVAGSLDTTGWILLDMGTEFDEMSERAHWDAFEKGLISPKQQEHRQVLRRIMESAGFETIPAEWWHYQLPVPQDEIDEYYPLIEEHEEASLTHPALLAEAL